MTMAAMEEMGAQNNNEGACEQKKPHSANYTAMEDVMVTMAYFKASEDSICAAKQREHTFRSKIELAYNTIKKQQEEKEAQDLLRPSHLRAMDTVAIPPIASGEELRVWKRHLHDRIYTRPSIHQSLCILLAMSSPRTTQKFLSLLSIEMTTNQSVVDEDGDVYEKKCKDGLVQTPNVWWAQRG